MELTDHQLKVLASKSIADKALFTIKGILNGIALDGIITSKEITELYTWCETHKDLVYKNPFKEFINTIQSLTLNGSIDREAIEDLIWLSQKYDGSFNYYDAITSDLQLLQGICHGIIADGEINDEEIYALDKWLDENEHLSNYYPYDEIRTLVLTIVSDKKIDEHERNLLIAYFSQFSNIQTPSTKLAIKEQTGDVKINAICTSNPNIDFDGRIFCITGTLNRCSRSDMERKIKDLGGHYSNTISTKTDYLIVGVNGSAAWAYSCYGRKVENALSLRKSGHTIQIIHEYDFCDVLDDLL